MIRRSAWMLGGESKHVSNLPEEEAEGAGKVFLLRAGLSHVSGTNWQRELKGRTSRRIYLRPQPSSVSFNDGAADA